MKRYLDLNVRVNDSWERFRDAIETIPTFQEMIHLFYFDNEMERLIKEEGMEYEDAYVEIFLRLLDLNRDLTIKNPIKAAAKYKEID